MSDKEKLAEQLLMENYEKVSSESDKGDRFVLSDFLSQEGVSNSNLPEVADQIVSNFPFSFFSFAELKESAPSDFTLTFKQDRGSDLASNQVPDVDSFAQGVVNRLNDVAGVRVVDHSIVTSGLEVSFALASNEDLNDKDKKREPEQEEETQQDNGAFTLTM